MNNTPRVASPVPRAVEDKLSSLSRSRGVETKVIDDRELVLTVEQRPDLGVDVVLERCIQHGTALYALAVLDAWGVPTVNRYEVAEICGNKLLTTMRLIRDGVPSPRTRVAFTPESALVAIEELGYPVVLKPLIGSWGRLISKVNDREAAEAIVEPKDVLGNYLHSIYYVQEYIHKPGRDIRAFVFEARRSPRSIARATIGSEHRARRPGLETVRSRRSMNELCVARRGRWEEACRGRRSRSARRPLVNEVNYTMEFRNSIDTTA